MKKNRSHLNFDIKILLFRLTDSMLQMLLKIKNIKENYLYSLDVIEFRGKQMKTFMSYKISGIILVLCLLCVPSLNALIIPGTFKNKVTSEQQIPLNSGKPDLIVLNIGYGAIGDAQNVHVVNAGVQNIGDAVAVGEIDFSYTIRRLPSLIIVRSHTGYSYVGIPPGTEGEIDFIIGYTQDLPKFGFFRVTCEVNPGRLINESNYDNNKGAQNFLVLFGYWLAIG